MVPLRALGPAAALLLCLAGCQSGVADLGLGPQSASSVAVQQADVPGDLKRCAGSGDIQGYLDNLKKRSAGAYQSTADGWKQLRSSGATEAAIVTYATDQSACTGELGVGSGRTVATFVVKYKDGGGAAAAWQRGILGFSTPQPGQQSPGLSQGLVTGLGKNSWTYQRAVSGRAVYLAFWQNREFDILALSADLSPEESRRIVSGVNGRVR